MEGKGTKRRAGKVLRLLSMTFYLSTGLSLSQAKWGPVYLVRILSVAARNNLFHIIGKVNVEVIPQAKGFGKDFLPTDSKEHLFWTSQVNASNR